MTVGPVSEAEVTIINTNARTGTIRMAQPTAVVGEHQGVISLNLTRTGGTDCDAAVLYRTVAIVGYDYGHYGINHLSQQGRVVWSEGDAAAKTIALPIVDNNEIQEGGEVFFVEIYGSTCAFLDPAAARTKVEVMDDERVGTLVVEKKKLLVSSIDSFVEVSIRRVGGSARPISLDFDLASGTALPGRDYRDRSGSLTWLSGEFGLRHIRVPILNDNSSTTELQRTFKVRLLYIVGTTVDADMIDITILNAYAQPGKIGFASMSQCRAPLPSMSDFCITLNEGETARLELVRTGGYAGLLSVSYTVTNFTRTAHDNFGEITGTVSWSDQDSASKYIAVPLLFDNDYRQKVDYLSVVISDAEALLPAIDEQRRQAYITILDQDGAGALNIEAAQSLFRESSGYVQLLVRRQCGLCAGGRISVDYETMDGDARRDVDFVAKRGRLTWEEGDLSDRSISVELVNDSTSSYTKHFKHMFMRLLNNSQNVLLDPRAMIAAVYIIDDNAVTGFPTFAPSFFSALDQTLHGAPVVRNVLEGTDQTIELTVTRLGGDQGNMSVRYRTLGLTAEEDEHFTAASGLLTWAEGDVSNRTISIDILDDDFFSPFIPLRTFRVILEDVTFSNGILSTRIYKGPSSTFAEVVIEEDEGWGLLSLDISDMDVDEDVGVINLTVHRKMGSSGDISVMVGDISGSASRLLPGSTLPRACSQKQPTIDVIEAVTGQAREVYCNGGSKDSSRSASIFRWDYSTRLWDRQCIERSDMQSPIRNAIVPPTTTPVSKILMSDFPSPVYERLGIINMQATTFDYTMSSFITSAANYTMVLPGATLMCTGICECENQTAGAASGTFSDGSTTYSSNADCTWLIAASSYTNLPKYSVTLSFPSFDTEPGFDYVYVYQCESASCSSRTELASLSGSSPVSVDTKFTSSTGFMEVVFQSDGTENKAGFQATWSIEVDQATWSIEDDLRAGEKTWQPMALPMQQSVLLMDWHEKQMAWCNAQCLDDPSFSDSFGFDCDGWYGYDCFSAYGLYSDAELLKVQKACPSSCSLCAAGHTGMLML